MYPLYNNMYHCTYTNYCDLFFYNKFDEKQPRALGTH